MIPADNITKAQAESVDIRNLVIAVPHRRSIMPKAIKFISLSYLRIRYHDNIMMSVILKVPVQCKIIGFFSILDILPIAVLAASSRRNITRRCRDENYPTFIILLEMVITLSIRLHHRYTIGDCDSSYPSSLALDTALHRSSIHRAQHHQRQNRQQYSFHIIKIFYLKSPIKVQIFNNMPKFLFSSCALH